MASAVQQPTRQPGTHENGTGFQASGFWNVCVTRPYDTNAVRFRNQEAVAVFVAVAVVVARSRSWWWWWWWWW